MSRRPPRTPATYSTRVARLLAVATEHVERGRLYVLPVEHDPGCPTLRTRSLADCFCEPCFRPPREMRP